MKLLLVARGKHMADLEVTRKFQKELNAGVSALLVLGLLVKADRPMYGYEIAMQLEGMSEEGLPMNHGALYPVLRSLELAHGAFRCGPAAPLLRAHGQRATRAGAMARGLAANQHHRHSSSGENP
jgi:hypothetical protein